MDYYEAKQSKLVASIGCICGGGMICVFSFCITLGIITLSGGDLRYDDYIGALIGIIVGTCFDIIIFAILVLGIITFRKQTDIYTRDRMYRKSGNKIIFELEYGKVIKIRNGPFGSVMFFLEEPVKRTDKKTAQKVIYELYSRKDTAKILRLIKENCPGIDCIY